MPQPQGDKYTNTLQFAVRGKGLIVAWGEDLGTLNRFVLLFPFLAFAILLMAWLISCEEVSDSWSNAISSQWGAASNSN